MLDSAAPFFGRRYQRALHNRRAAIMRDTLLRNQRQHLLRIELAQTDIHARSRCERPRKTPAIAMKHGQGPEVDRVLGHIPFENIGNSIDRRTPVVIDHTFGITGSTRGVVQCNRIPFICWHLPDVIRVRFSQHGFVR